MKAKDFEQAFDDGEDILESLDLSKAKRSMQDQNQQCWRRNMPLFFVFKFAIFRATIMFRRVRQYQYGNAEDGNGNGYAEQ